MVYTMILALEISVYGAIFGKTREEIMLLYLETICLDSAICAPLFAHNTEKIHWLIKIKWFHF